MPNEVWPELVQILLAASCQGDAAEARTCPIHHSTDIWYQCGEDCDADSPITWEEVS